MSFVTRDVALAVINGIRETLVRLERRDRSLADQARRAATSIVLNIEEGNQRKGGDRQHLFRAAKGSAAELRAALLIGVAWGYIDEPRDLLALLERLERLLYGLVRPQSRESSRSRSASTDSAD
jgi:four helix bundle protein